MSKLTALIIGDIAVLRIPKVASTSMQRLSSMPGCRITEEGDFPPIPMIAFVREPLERFYSAARNFADNPKPLPFYPYRGTYEEFVDYTLRYSNSHWDPQYYLLKEVNRPITLYPYDSLNEVWAGYGFPPLPFEHCSKDFDFPEIDKEYKLDLLVNKYSCDARLRQSIKQGGGSCKI